MLFIHKANNCGISVEPQTPGNPLTLAFKRKQEVLLVTEKENYICFVLLAKRSIQNVDKRLKCYIVNMILLILGMNKIK